MADHKKAEAPKKKGLTADAYYMRAKNGGFQLFKLTIVDDVILADTPVSDPDAWNQIMSELEHEISAKFQ